MDRLVKPSVSQTDNQQKRSLGRSTSLVDGEESETDTPYFDNIINPLNQTTCDGCRKNITQYAHIFCELGDYCVDCFASLKPFPSSYHMIGHLNFPLIDKKWSALDELLLIGGIEKYGFGNWVEIRNQLGGSKTIQEIEEHYDKWLEMPQNALQIHINSMKEKNNIQIGEETRKTYVKQTFQLKMMREQMKNQQYTVDENKLKIVGFIPKRGDFEIQYDNDLELIVSEMEFLDSDTSQETLLKYKILDIFTERLNKRNQIKDFVVKRNLLDLNGINRKDRKKPKQEKDAGCFLRPFARFMAEKQYDSFTFEVAKEKMLRQQIFNQRQSKRKNVKPNQETIENGHSRKKSVSIRKRLKNKQDGFKLPMISERELQLCKRSQLSQTSFVLIKQTIKSELSRKGKLQTSNFQSIFKVHPNIIKQIFAMINDEQASDIE